jgi:hypothetical protein
MFVGVVLFFPDGVVGTAQKLIARLAPQHRTASPVTGSPAETFEKAEMRR